MADQELTAREEVARALGIADTYGPNADNDGQVKFRENRWATRWSDADHESTCDCGSRHIQPGRDHYRMLSDQALAVITRRIRAEAARRIEDGDPGSRALEQMAEELER